MVFLISQPALESDEVYRELVRAIELGKAIVPLRLVQAPLYGWFKEKLGAIQHIEYDAQDPDEKWWGKLQAALRHSRRVSHRQDEPVKAEPEPSPPKTRRKRGVPKMLAGSYAR